ncbi:MAG: hypothetical protein P8Y58_17260 [Novosphingobium sp.]
MDNQRNIILAVVLTALVLFGWDAGIGYFYPQAKAPVRAEQTAAAQQAAKPDDASKIKPTREGGLRDAADVALEKQDLKVALSRGGRVPVAAPGLSGSINLTGALIDDLVTRDLYDAQERYVLLFDRTRKLSLHLFEHVHGESRDRGQAMVDLAQS